MVTILTFGNSEGSRRCDATCHEASKPECDCVCGGRYHGKGSTDQAQQQLHEDLLGGLLGPELQAAAEAAAGGQEALL